MLGARTQASAAFFFCISKDPEFRLMTARAKALLDPLGIQPPPQDKRALY